METLSCSFQNNPELCGPATTKPCPGSPPFSPPPPYNPTPVPSPGKTLIIPFMMRNSCKKNLVNFCLVFNEHAAKDGNPLYYNPNASFSRNWPTKLFHL